MGTEYQLGRKTWSGASWIFFSRQARKSSLIRISSFASSSQENQRPNGFS